MSTSKKQRQASFSGKLDIQKPKNKDVRPREYLTEAEVERLMKAAAKTGRHGHRDSTLILVTYRHGFRVSELTALRWDHVGLDSVCTSIEPRRERPRFIRFAVPKFEHSDE